jgi:molybdopterin molybdotransferase
MTTNDATDRPHPQRIARLTPLSEVLARIDSRVEPVAARSLETSAALGRILAEDIVVQAPIPASALALRDGWAVQSDLTLDAGAYAPAPLASAPRVETGEPLPTGADAVAPLDAITLRSGIAHALSPVSAGEGVLPAGGDAAAGAVLIQGGRRLGPLEIALLRAAGIQMARIREPRVLLVRARPQPEGILDAVIEWIADAIRSEGGVPIVHSAEGGLQQPLNDSSADAVVTIGGTGTGASDATVRTLAAAGELHVRGIALVPGETAALASVGARPVLALPGRLDAALAVWLVIGRRLLARLTGRIDAEPTMKAKLARKIASPLGFAEVVPVHVRDGTAEPIASGYLPLAALAQADGWILVPPDSEGYPAGAEVVIRAWS